MTRQAKTPETKRPLSHHWAADLRGTRIFALMRSSNSSRDALSLGKRPLLE